ncbi:MAG: hypothetical protein JRM76_07610 [Nitrososphaerota archaeon]|nr:hypothetical protein [Nitrososphaerota archaeon]MDG6971154.1 hypothetical protein [Nitrososphaerota archaeon]MDG6993090.1 hypothetical protein [Nitrososphaerota archaeon]
MILSRPGSWSGWQNGRRGSTTSPSSPKGTRVLFKEKGWDDITAFQTRERPHIGHECAQKIALRVATPRRGRGRSSGSVGARVHPCYPRHPVVYFVC